MSQGGGRQKEPRSRVNQCSVAVMKCSLEGRKTAWRPSSEFIKQQRGMEGSRWKGQWGERKMKPVPEWEAGVMEALSLMLPILAPPACPFPIERLERGEEMRGGRTGVGSEGGDVIECVVKLFTDGLVFHLLCIDFIF